MKDKFSVAGIGELLWDLFPDGKRLGGAPSNFAYHAHQLGAESYPVSCVGEDVLGVEAFEQLGKLGILTIYMTPVAEYPTGTVDVVLHSGKPSYQIHEDVAWDHITYSSTLMEFARSLDAVCFGSLSQRGSITRDTIHAFLEDMPSTALKICDVNLRQNFYSRAIIETSLESANVLKLSDEELPVLAGYFDLQDGVDTQLEQLRERFDLRLIAYTRGAEGSVLLSQESMDIFDGIEADVIDTVGAGDSFTAALSMGLLHQWPLSQVNRFANQVAAYVCSQPGATPALPVALIRQSVVA